MPLCMTFDGMSFRADSFNKPFNQRETGTNVSFGIEFISSCLSLWLRREESQMKLEGYSFFCGQFPHSVFHFRHPELSK